MNDCRFTLDSSALLAVFNREAGAELVESVLSSCQIGSVNLAEIATKLNEYGYGEDEISQTIDEADLTVIAFDRVQAVRAGAMRAATRAQGLSLGDRACLTLAQMTGTIALTADRAWLDLNLKIEIKLIR